MTNELLEKKLSNIFIKIAKKEITFWQATDLYSEAQKVCDNASKEKITDKARETMAKIFIIFVGKNEDYCGNLVKGEFKFANKDLDKLEANFKEILKIIDLIHDKCPQIIDADYVAKTKENIKESKKLITSGREFANLRDKINCLKEKKNFSWQGIEEVWDEVKKKASVSQSVGWLTETAQTQKWGFLGEIAELCWEIAEAVAKGGKQDIPSEIYPSTHEELNFFQEIADEVSKMVDWLEEKFVDKIKNKEIKEKNEQLKSFIQEQRKKLGSSQKPTNKPNLQDQQKIQNQQKEIDYLKQQLAELQKQITELKQNQKDTDAKPEITKKIETLESKKQEIQSELNKKQSQQKELKDKANSSQSNNSDNGFKWWYVAIPSAILLVIMGIVIAYLMGKNKKKH
ncbi:hypothetical protein [endosymbiont GvMRE of Glomus versiforme]|uniref:hypothetical protein n=1 Tax=endosymbiont GvMRE of Glomus versiforme TaxID=2039283 RepID=UPI0011C4693B|nr:hypothetical protein [endosymbiont GvMRE of Glomus versiforme]